MKKILLIANYKGLVGGISGQVEILQRHISNEKDHCASIFSTDGAFLVRVWLFLRLILAARRCDVLHAHGCSSWGFLPIVYGVIAGKIWRKKVIITYHGGGADEFFKHHGTFARRWLLQADKVIVLNGYLERVFHTYNIPTIVIPNIIELSEKEVHSDYQWEAPRIISVRHLSELYNIPCILQAYATIKQQLPGAKLTVLGDGPLRGELEEWVKNNHVDDVVFTGQVDNNEVAGYLAQSDIMLSAPHIDNMPVSVLEAMKAGVIVISSQVGGVPYIIEDAQNGLLFEDNNVKELAKRILWVCKHPDESETILKEARADVQKYEWAQIRESILRLY